jgi:HEAT repeat protein
MAAASHRPGPARLPPLVPAEVADVPLLRPLCLTLLVVSALVPLRDDDPPRPVEELVAEIEERGDKTPAATFDELGRHATKEAFAAIQDADRHVSEYGAKLRLYRSLRFFAADAELGEDAAGYLERRCRHRESDVYYAAAYALAEMGAAGAESAERLCRRPPHDWIGAIALPCVLRRMETETKRGDLVLLLEHFHERYSGDAEELVTALARFDGPAELRRMQGYLTERGARRWIQLRVVAALERIGSSRAQRALAECVADGPADDVCRAAIESLDRLGYDDHRKDLEELADEGTPLVAAAALVARAQLEPRAERWVERIHALALDPEPLRRETAALALVELLRRKADGAPTEQESAALASLMDDEEERVRDRLVQELLTLRSPACVPLFFERLERAGDEEREALHTALELLTGVDHGASPHRWRAWWEAEGQAAALPSLEVATERRKERQRRRNKERRTTFYGMNVTQENVCFVMDASGSMEAKNEWDETRLDVVKQEVEGALTRMKNGTSFNVVFFGSTVRRWREELTPMDDETRREAIAFVKEQGYLGGTAVYDALKAVFADPRVEHIYLLSDGQPYGGEIDDPKAIVEEVERWNRKRGLRIHCISAGYVNKMLVELAELTGGQFREAD